MTDSHHDTDISAMYRRSHTLRSNDALDQRILDYAHKAIRQKQRAKPWVRFGYPLAMAASVVLGIVIMRSLVAPHQQPATPRYLAKNNNLANIPVTSETKPAPVPRQASDTRLANTASQPVAHPAPQNRAPVKHAKRNQQQPASTTQEKAFAKKAVTNNPLIAPVNSTIGQPDASRMQTQFEKIQQLLKDGNETEAKKALATFLRKYPHYEPALKMQKALRAK